MTGIIAPSDAELLPVLQMIHVSARQKKAKLEFIRGDIDGKEVVAVFSGVCKVNMAIAAQVMINCFDVNELFLTGVAGSLEPNVKPFEIVVATEVCHHDVEPEILTEYHPFAKTEWFAADKKILSKIREFYNTAKIPVHFARIITGEQFISQTEQHDMLKKFGAVCVDMESAAFAQVCAANTIPFCVVRVITDNCDEASPEIFEKNLDRCSKIAAESIIAYVKKFG